MVSFGSSTIDWFGEGSDDGPNKMDTRARVAGVECDVGELGARIWRNGRRGLLGSRVHV